MKKNTLKICPICKEEKLMTKKQTYCSKECTYKNNKNNNSPWRRGFI